jgi:amidase
MSREMRSELPPAAADAPLAARWRAAGLLIMGRTNTPEFAGEFVTEPTWRGATRWPPGSSAKCRGRVAWRRCDPGIRSIRCSAVQV